MIRLHIFKSGRKQWYLNGKHHREDGPAIECLDGSKEWWINGKRQPRNLKRENNG